MARFTVRVLNQLGVFIFNQINAAVAMNKFFDKIESFYQKLSAKSI